MQEPDRSIPEALARGDLASATVSEAERALLEFVALVTRSASRTTDEDVGRLRRSGWTDEQIAECVYVTALFAFFNRVADAFGLADPQYATHPPPRGGEPTGLASGGAPP